MQRNHNYEINQMPKHKKSCWHYKTLHASLIFTFYSQSLNCVGMKLQTIEEGAFRGLNSLKNLILGQNNLVSPPALEYINNIEQLYLFQNLITTIPKDYFRACHEMVIFDIAFNNLLSLPEMSHMSHSLRDLNLSYNRLRDLDVLTRSNWLNLRILSVSHNDISEIQDDLITKMSSLQSFFIAHNKLQSLPDFRRFVSSWNDLVIDVEGNPWYCDQTLDWVRHGIGRANVMKFGKLLIVDVTGMICRGPPIMNGSVLWDMSKCKHIIRVQLWVSDRDQLNHGLVYGLNK